MKKSYLIMAAAAALFAACSSNDLVEEKTSQIAQQTAEEQAVAFDSYVSRGTTRAGYSGELTTGTLQNNAPGFGVFGYYTDGERYAGNTKPNFFYNQKVYWDSGSWVYSPIKYWPNEFGTDAISDQVDRVTFFAYAPWVDVDPLTGIAKPETSPTATETEKNAKDPTTNITSLTRNNATGDPFVKYTATMDPTNTVDLCYGVAAENFTSSVSTSFPNSITAGEPFIDLTKPSLGSKIKFNFKHALSKLNVRIDAFVNEAAPPTTGKLNAFTKIWVRSVTFEGITTKGSLNLHSGDWYQIDASGDNKISSGKVTVYDGRKDGKEPLGTAANELPATLNPALVQSLMYDDNELGTALKTTDPTNVTGVTETPVNLFKTSGTGTPATQLAEPVYVIPTGEKMKVTIVYDVETYDPNLAYYLSDGTTLGSSIQNTITKDITSFGELEPGKQYVLQLHLGMRSVDFEAEVVAWDAEVTANPYLPSNTPTVSAGSPATPATTVVQSTTTTYSFDIINLKAGESVTSPSDAGNLSGAICTAADAEGKATANITISANNTVKDFVNPAVVWTGGESGNAVSLVITQKACPLGLTVTGTIGSAGLTLNSTATGINWKTDIADPTTDVKVKKNGVSLPYGTTGFVVNLTDPNHYIYLYTGDVVAGDTYTVTVKAGDALEETVSKTF